MITSFMKLLIVKQILLVSAIGKYKENSVENLNGSFRVERESHFGSFFLTTKNQIRDLQKFTSFILGRLTLNFDTNIIFSCLYIHLSLN